MTRKTISLLTLFSFLILIVSSLAMYALPIPGPGTLPEQLFWGGVHRRAWKEMHITGGFLFLFAAAWHTILNARSIAGYLKKTAPFSWKNSFPFAVALMLTLLVYAGTVKGFEPMKTITAAKIPSVATVSVR